MNQPDSITRFPSAASRRRGAVTVEMAITLPLMFLVVFASVEFGRMNMMRHTVDNAAYEGARKAIVPGATAAQAEAEARRIMATIGSRGVAVTVTPATIDLDTRQVNVRVTVNADQNGFIANTFFRGRQLTGSVTMNREHL
jgi:Flp pilus assembly protein TadG